MNKLLVNVTENDFEIIVEGTSMSGDACIARLPMDHAQDVLMLMSAGVKLKQSEHAGEFLARFLDGDD